MSKVNIVLVLLNDLLNKINGFIVESGKFSSVSRLSRVNLGLDALVGALQAFDTLLAQVLELLLEISLDLVELLVELILNHLEAGLVGLLLRGHSLLVRKRDSLDDSIDVVVESGLGDYDDDEVIFHSVLVDVGDKIFSLALAHIVLWCLLVETENLHGGRALDLVLLCQVTVGHDIDSTEFDLFVRKSGVSRSKLELRVEGLAVGAPVSIEGNDPGVLRVLHDLLFKVTASEGSNVVACKEGVDVGRDKSEGR